MKQILINNCLACPFSHFTLIYDSKGRVHLYCGHKDMVVCDDMDSYDNIIPEWCDLEDHYEDNGPAVEGNIYD